MKLFFKPFCILLLIVSFADCNTETNTKDPEKTRLQESSFHQAAEFEPMDAIWLLYPQITHKKGYSNEAAELTIINALAPSVKIKWIVPNDTIKQLVLKLLPDSLIKNGAVTILNFAYSQFWARDMGPAFLMNDKGEKAIADFNFNNWGYTDTSDAMAHLDEKLDERIAAYYKLPLISTNMVSEGGDHEVNGKGVLIACEAVEKQRNPDMSLQQMEDEFKRVLGISKIIWLKQGVRDDDETFFGPVEGPGSKKYFTTTTTNGHVDEYARFANDSTILLAYVDNADRKNDMERITGERMEANYNILKDATDQDGKPFHIIKVPMPHPVLSTMQPGDGVYDQLGEMKFSDGTVFPNGKTIDVVAAASYLNFLIANDKVLVAKYWKEGMPLKIKERDEEAQRILQSAFPGKKIIFINALAINFGGGGMHCITMNEPKAK